MKTRSALFFACLLASAFLPSVSSAETLSALPPGQSDASPSRWISERLGFALRSVDAGHLRDPQSRDIVAITDNRLFVFTRESGKLTLVSDYQSPHSTEEFLRLYLHDVDGDGRDEALITAFHYNKIASFVLKWEGEGKWTRMTNNVKYLLAVRDYQGSPVIMGQKTHYKENFQGPIYRMSAEKGKFKADEIPDLPYDLALFGTQFITLNQNGQNVPAILSLKPSGTVMLYAKRDGAAAGKEERWYRRWTSGERYGGATEYVAKEQKTVLNETLSERWFAEPDIAVLKSSPRSFVVLKNEDYLKGVVGKEPSIKWSALYRFEWSGLGFRRVWESEQFDGKITDMKTKDLDGDGREEMIAVLQLRDRGYFDGLNPRKDSVVIIYDSF